MIDQIFSLFRRKTHKMSTLLQPYSPTLLPFIGDFFVQFPEVHFFRIGMAENKVFIHPSRPVFRCWMPYCKHSRVPGEKYLNPYAFKDKLEFVDEYCTTHCSVNNYKPQFKRGDNYSNFVYGSEEAYVEYNSLKEYEKSNETLRFWDIVSQIGNNDLGLAQKEQLELKIICKHEKNIYYIFTLGSYFLKFTHRPSFGYTWVEAKIYYDAHAFNSGHAYWWGNHRYKSRDEPIFCFLNLKGKKSIEFRRDCMEYDDGYEIDKVSDLIQ